MDEMIETLSLHLENARWLIDEERNRIDGFHQRASYFLGFTGVILAILPVIIDPITSTRNSGLRNAAWALAMTTVILLVGAVFFAVKTMAVRSVLEVPISDLQSRWISWSSALPNAPDRAQVLSDYVNSLFGREPIPTESALLSLRSESEDRARFLRQSVWLSLGGFVALGSLIIVLMASRM